MARLREKKKQGLREFFLRKVREEGQTVFSATYQEIAAMSGVSLGTVVKGLRVLEQEGFLKIRRGPSRRVPNSYAVLLASPHSGRTFGEELQDLSARRQSLERQVAALGQQLAAYESLLDSCLVSQPLPGGTHLLVVPGELHARVLELRREDERLLRRLLDRRGIGAGLRRLRQNPTREGVLAFEARLRRRLEDAQVASPRLRSLIARLEEALLSLSGQEDLELALAQAETAYEELLRRLGEEQEKPSAVLPPEEPSTLTA